MLDKFVLMTVRQYTSSDFDADHPMCKWLITKHQLSYVQGLWLTILAMAFYDEASAWVAFNRSTPFCTPADCKLPIDKNRRNLYGTQIIHHLDEVCQAYHNRRDWPTTGFRGDPAKDWYTLKDNLRSVWGNGRFACYTTADMLHKVNGVDITVGDFENRSSSGPADAIQRITGCDRKDVVALDKHGEEINQRILTARRHPTYTRSDRGTVESVLCNFSGMCRGRYYPGRNIDRQQDRILRLTKLGHGKIVDVLWEARQDIFRREHLGEFNGWVGVNKPRLTHFKETGEILCPEDKR